MESRGSERSGCSWSSQRNDSSATHGGIGKDYPGKLEQHGQSHGSYGGGAWWLRGSTGGSWSRITYIHTCGDDNMGLGGCLSPANAPHVQYGLASCLPTRHLWACLSALGWDLGPPSRDGRSASTSSPFGSRGALRLLIPKC